MLVLAQLLDTLPADHERAAEIRAALGACCDVIAANDDDVSVCVDETRAALDARAREPSSGRRAPRERDRPRAHRQRVAVADPRDQAQVRAHVLQRAAPHGRLPRVPLLRVAGAAVHLDQGELSAPLRTDPGPGARRAVRARGEHVGGGRLQHPVGRVARAPDRARQAVLPRRARPRDHRPVAPRRVRLLRRAAADPGRGGHHVVPHAEDVVERDQPLPAPHLLVGGDRRHAASSRTSRLPTPTTAT